MRLKQLVKLGAQLCGVSVPSDLDTAEARTDTTVSLLVDCCNLVLDELYREYAASVCKTTVEPKDGFIDTSALPLGRVISLTDNYGCDVPFRYTQNGLITEQKGRLNLCYTRTSIGANWDDELPMPTPQISARILVYGVVAEFLQIAGDVNGYSLWRQRYQDALRVSCRSHCRRLPLRRWLW